jgi:DNA polymerase III epsilon subunit-like protein
MSGYIVFFDFETGGIEPSKPEIQLAAIACNERFEEVASFESKIAFNEADADPKALEINHYDRAAWEGAPSPGVVVKKFAAFTEQFRSVEMISKRTGRPYSVARLAGHNAATFDAPRLRRMFDQSAVFAPFHPIPLDTLQLALWHFQCAGSKPDNLQLSTIAKHFGINAEGAHDALADVRLSAKIASKLWIHGAKELSA